MKIPNQEQLEAEHAAVIAERDALIARISPEEGEKFVVVEECLKKLKDAGLIFFFYPYLPVEYGGSDFWQFNSLSEIAFDEKGIFCPGSLSDINCSFLSAVFATFKTAHGGDIIHFTKLMLSAMIHHAESVEKRLKEKEDRDAK